MDGKRNIGRVSLGYAILIAILCLMVLFTLCANKLCRRLRACASRRLARVSSQREGASNNNNNEIDNRDIKIEEGAAHECKSVKMYYNFSSKQSKGTRVGEEEAVCSICMEEFREGEGLHLLPNCGHVFHAACVNAWLCSNASCPLCRVISPSPSPLHPPPPPPP